MVKAEETPLTEYGVVKDGQVIARVPANGWHAAVRKLEEYLSRGELVLFVDPQAVRKGLAELGEEA